MRVPILLLALAFLLSAGCFLPAQAPQKTKEQTTQSKSPAGKQTAEKEPKAEPAERLATLRRRQKKPDPLQIQIVGSPNRECIFPHLPEYHVQLTNCDADNTPVLFTCGGDYRHGHQARWRFDVRDAAGRAMPVKEDPGYGRHIAGGLYSEDALQHRESWDTILHMDSFIELDPGDYTLRVQYCERATIANMKSTDGLIVFQSKPLSLHVQPRVIDIARKDKERVQRWVAELDEDYQRLVLTGSYGQHAHDFIAPDSAAGRLLAAGWKAVPGLLDAVANDKLSARKRAWLLAILFSLTGPNDPRPESGVLGSFMYRDCGWQVSRGLSGKMDAGGFGISADTMVYGGQIDPSKLRQFARRWQRFQDCVVVRER